MSGSGTGTGHDRVDPGERRHGGPHTPTAFVDWLRTRTGTVVALVWIGVLVTLCALIRMTPLTLALNSAAVLFGLYGSSVAFRKDRVAGYIVLIGLAFSIMLLNSFLFLIQNQPRFGG